MTPLPYFADLAAAFVRGTVMQNAAFALHDDWLHAPLESLSDDEKRQIAEAGMRHGLKLHRFKRSHADLPRVRRTLGFLRGIAPRSLLDVGSGRGAFLWPCLDAFPELHVTAVDVDPHRVQLYETVRQGGVERLCGTQADVQHTDFPERIGASFDVVTLLEVLEHLPNPDAVLKNAMTLADRHLAISVPSKEDDNPEHLRLFSRETMTSLLVDAGIVRFQFDYVPGHMLVFATLQQETEP